MFFVVNRFSTFVYAVIAASITAIVHGATASFLRPFGLPALTFPFNFVAWVFCLAGNVMGSVFTVEITAISVAEDHIKRVRLVELMASKFKEIKMLSSQLNVKRPEDLNKLEKSLTPVLLCWYASTGDIKQLKKLVSLGVNINSADYDGRTALHLASAEEQVEVL